MKIGIAQINTKLGDLNYNENKIISAIQKMGKEADVIVFPEMTITGYPLNDMLDDERLVKKQKEIIYKIRDVISQINSDLKVILGFIDYNEREKLPSGQMRKWNAAAVIGNDIQIYHKQLLPNYDVFFEQRYFAAGDKDLTFGIGQDEKGAITICEDIRDENYDKKPIQAYKNRNVDTIFNISSSPFSAGKRKKRLELLKKHAQDLQANLVYVNQVGAQDELVFDGASMIMSKHGNLVHLSKQFEEDLCIVDTDVKEQEDNAASILYEYEGKNREMLGAMKLGLQEYLVKTGIKDVVIGVSGGVDSALSLYVLSQILPPEHIHAIYMPTRHNSTKSLELSQKLANNLGIQLRVGEIDELVNSFTSFATDKLQKKPEGITYENLQARIRGTILMNIANDVHGMVINNSNKTELALGYGTLYGDLIGGLSFIGDLNKREIYDMVRYINHKETHDIIPDEIITRKASAELADGQIDPFDYDKISDAVEELQFGVDIEKVAKKYQIDIAELEKLKKRIKINEFKIRQAPPVIKLKERSVGIGRLYPIVE